MTETEPAVRRGRPRDRAKDVAVLEATIALLAREGLSRVSMDRVATAAGVSKVTIYTRWSSRDDLIAAALRHLELGDLPPATGDLRADLASRLEAMRRQYERVGGMSIIGSCLAEEPSSGQMLEIIRRSTLLPRRQHFAEVVHAAVERGALPGHLDVERFISLLIGSLYADHLAGRPLDEHWAPAVVDLALRGALA
ncbi:MAG: TetR/AcrR family transcriptional regulator [Quadrisphaera sp.]